MLRLYTDNLFLRHYCEAYVIFIRKIDKDARVYI